jgi:ketosteroid isomerase-like protein
MRLSRQVALAVAAAHEQGVIHRDLKPENVLVVPDPDVPGGERTKVVDFGTTNLTESPSRGRPYVAGTPPYMSPEQLRDTRTAGTKTDVFALGVMMNEMLAGGQRPGTAVLPPGCPERLSKLIQQMQQPDASRRPSMQAVAEELHALHAAPVRRFPWHRAVRGAAIVGVAAAAVAVGVHLWRSKQADDCYGAMVVYDSALASASETARKLPDACTFASRSQLVPETRLSEPCKALWRSHVANIQYAIDTNVIARAACPGKSIPDVGMSLPSAEIMAAVATSTSEPPEPPQLTYPSITKFIRSQATAFAATGAFVDAFADSAVVFFPATLQAYEGQMQIANGFRDAWYLPDHEGAVAVANLNVGIRGAVAWVTSEWYVTYQRATKPTLVRITELIEPGPSGPRIVAAHFSTPPPRGGSGISTPLPALANGVPPGEGPESWLTAPRELANHLHGDPAASLFGSDEQEKAIGTEAVRKLLALWANLQLEIVGSVRIIERDGYRAVLEFARSPKSPTTVYRVLAVFVPADGTAASPRWEAATVHYSAAVP